jgi:large subunit ribosomal protein L25
MGLINLEIFPRTTSGKNANRRTRAEGRVPAVIYGKGRKTELIELDARSFGKILKKSGGSASVFMLEGDEEKIALLREVQSNPVTDELLHVDLMQIPRGVPVTLDVAVQIVGTCHAVKSGEASVALSLDTIELSCLPKDLPEAIEIDITELKVHDKIFVRDLTAPVGEIVSEPDILILNIKPSTLALEEETEVAEGEVAEETEAAAGTGAKPAGSATGSDKGKGD